MGYGDAAYPRDMRYRDHVNQNFDVSLEDYPHPHFADVESTIACLLWDIYDIPNDGLDHLGASMIPIWDVFRNYLTNGHHVYNIEEFWNGWMARGWDLTHDIWSIFLYHGIQEDVNPPTNPNSWSSDPVTGVWSNDNTVWIQWWGATDDISGVYGYSFAWDTSASTIPDETVDTTDTIVTSSPLPDGSWYIHVRTVDYAGWWASDAFHIGPFRIDATAPSNPTSWSSSHTANAWSNDVTIDVTWYRASDGSGSGVYGYSYSWTTSPTLPDTTIDTTGTSVTSPPLPEGWGYLNIRTRDNAGHWNNGYIYCGPFGIDTGSPNNPNSYTSSHTINVWSTDNTIDISWSGASDSTSGVLGYSFIWDTSSTTIPDTMVDTTGASTTSSALPNGDSWYFHVRTRDNAGNWASGTFHVGPFYIEATQPPPGGGGCVLRDTQILMADGKTMSVQALKPGDEIMGYNVQTGTFVIETVTSNKRTIVNEMISINNGLLYLTPTDQPIYTDHGWIRNPQDLEVGWKIYEPMRNAWITISSLETLRGRFQVYDVRTTAPNTFIANGILLDSKEP